MRKVLVLSLIGLLSLVIPSSFAHSELVSSNPAASANIQDLPEQIGEAVFANQKIHIYLTSDWLV
jgi:methionine-rich copper-binding protein CopC